MVREPSRTENTMRTNSEIAKNIRAALEHEPRVNLHRSSIDIEIHDSGAVLEGEVSSIEEKRTAVECAKSVPGVAQVADHLRVRPTARLGDGAIRDAVCRQLMQEPAFQRMAITCRVGGDDEEISRRPDEAEGSIEASITNGTVTLRGEVWSRSHKRLAAVLAWWAPGCRNVLNELAVKPAERDTDDEIRDAIELVLNKDPIVHSGQITTQVRDGRVVLRGIVATREEKSMAERDIWFIEGVRDIKNELDVYQGPTGREVMPASPPSIE